MECRLSMSQDEWNLLLELLESERRELPVLIRRTDTAEPRHALQAKRDMIDRVIEQVQEQLVCDPAGANRQ